MYKVLETFYSTLIADNVNAINELVQCLIQISVPNVLYYMYVSVVCKIKHVCLFVCLFTSIKHVFI